MMTYLLQMTICSLLLLGVYYFFLEKETMHRFKRFYLVFSLVLSITVPFISIEVSGDSSLIGKLPFVKTQIIANTIDSVNEKFVGQEQEDTKTGNLINTLTIGYIIVAGILLSRYIVNIAHIVITIKKNEHVTVRNTKIVLVNAEAVPHSFGRYVFLNKNEYKAGLIEEEVLTHEMTHIKQWHSLDILFIELMLIVFWFNPILYLYKNRMKLNHEFLADEGVISAYNDVPHYQMILIDKISRQNSLSLTSNFNYLLTKKRLTMMTKTTSVRIAVAKRIIMLPLFLVFAFAFCTKKVNEQTKTDEGNAGIAEVKNDNVEIKKDTVKIEVKEKEKEIVRFTPPKIVKDGEAKKKETVKFTPPVMVKDKEQAPPPPPIKVEKKETKDSNEPGKIKLEKEEKVTPPTESTKKSDVIEIKVSDKKQE